MKHLRILAFFLLTLCSAQLCTIMAQGYGIYVDGKFVSLQDGDKIQLEGTNPEDSRVTVLSDGQIKAVLPSGQITFFGDLERYFQQIPTTMLDLGDYSTHSDFGYPSQMIVRDMLTGDYRHEGSIGYSHFIQWSRNNALGEKYVYPNNVWKFYERFVQAANQLIGAIDPAKANAVQLGYLGVGQAYRALGYLDMARMYEYLPNEATTSLSLFGSDLTNLTVPIVTEKTTSEQAKNLPRATRQEMARFIASDLDEAEKNIVNYQGNSTMPSLAAVYGLKARLYMWMEDYAQAERYAQRAIEAAQVGPIAESEALDVRTGYNQASQFLWAVQQNAQHSPVVSGLISWNSWVSNESSYGYTGSIGLYLVMDKSMYDRISNTDWRKKQWVAPAGSPLYGQNAYAAPHWSGYQLDNYASLKFRLGEGNFDDNLVGNATAVPLMRVEEMYFIQAEAAAHQDDGRGRQLLNHFMATYRDPSYNCTLEGASLIEEIVFQKRVELWGEGQTFFDIKRLNMSVTRSYEGVNCVDNASLLNTNGRPAWMNLVFPITARRANIALLGMNNPDPSGLYASGGGVIDAAPSSQTQISALVVDAPMKELLGYKQLLTLRDATVQYAGAPGLIRIVAPYSYLRDMDIPALSVAEDNGFNIQLDGTRVAIPMQGTGCSLNGSEIRIASTQEGTFADGVITFPANAITLYVGDELTVVNSKAQFEVRLTLQTLNASVYYNEYNAKFTSFHTRDGQTYLHQLVTVPEGETDCTVRAILVPYQQQQEAILQFEQDEEYGYPMSADNYIDIPVPEGVDYFALCYAFYRRGVLIKTGGTSMHYPHVQISLNINPVNPGDECWKVNYYIGSHAEKAYIAVVTEDMDNDAIRQAFEQGKLNVVEVPVNDGYVLKYTEIPIPQEHGCYRLVGIVLRGGQVINVGTLQDSIQYNPDTQRYEWGDSYKVYELPRAYQLSLDFQGFAQTDEGGNVSFSLESDPEIASTTVAILPLERYEACKRHIYTAAMHADNSVNCPTSGQYTISLPTFDSEKPYVLVAVGYERDGRVAKCAVSGSFQAVSEQWKSLGMGILTENFLIGNACQVEILQKRDDPTQFRILKPFDGFAEMMELDGNQSPTLDFRILQPGTTLFDTPITYSDLVYFETVNTGYYHSSYERDIMMHHPASFSSLRGDETNFLYSKVLHYQQDGVTPGQIQLAPYYYMQDVGGWNQSIYDDVVVITFPRIGSTPDPDPQPTYTTIGTADWSYTVLFGNDDGTPYVDAGLELQQCDTDPTQYRLLNWGYGVTLNFTIDQDNHLFVPEQEVGYDHPSYGQILISDLVTYTGDSNYASKQLEDGTYEVMVNYYVSAGSFGNGPEYLKLYPGVMPDGSSRVSAKKAAPKERKLTAAPAMKSATFIPGEPVARKRGKFVKPVPALVDNK